MSDTFDPSRGVWTRRRRIIGWLCALGTALVIFDLVTLLRRLPQHWWTPEIEPLATPHGMTFDLRVMSADLGLGWFGGWGYLAAFVWVPLAVWSALRARRMGARWRGSEVGLLVLVLIEVVSVSLLVHLTPLKYPQYNVPLL